MVHTRRQVIGALSVAAASFGGCSLLVQPLTSFCADDPRFTDPRTPLTIDIHCHVFNGSDIQVAKYIELVRARVQPALAPLGEILQEVGWETAPTGVQEISVLQDISRHLSAVCRPGELEQVYFSHRQNQYEKGVEALNLALDKVQVRFRLRQATPKEDTVAKAIRSLPKKYADFDLRRRRRRALQSSGGDSAVEAALTFVLRQFQYRYVNVFDFLTEYSSGTARKVDLLICHLLDFDWPLAMGLPTMTSIEDQINVMEQISILTGGRVHAYAPFDPMKQVAFNLGFTDQFPLGMVQKAVTSQGFIGVKLYLPMGFAPFGNEDVQRLDHNFWNKKWIPSQLRRSDLGRLLDDALFELYGWCEANRVPVMAHTSDSEGPSDEFEALTAANYWQRVPGELTVNFGHFGNTEIDSDAYERAADFARLMGPAGSNGANFYADSAYFSHALTDQKGVTDALRYLYRSTQSNGAVPLAQSLMYGSDWEMLIIEGGDTAGYLQDFEKIFSTLDRESLGAQGKLSDRFFGTNAANYLSLRSGQLDSTRARLDSFYSRAGVSKPIWAQKVDRLSPLSV
jgi:hypothetical protein